MGKIFVVGIGPGDREHMTREAEHAIEESDLIVGYTTYVELLRGMYPEKEFLQTGMKQERERCELCLQQAREGKIVSLICSGDAGVYGMASLMLEVAGNACTIPIRIVSGVTAALSGAALLGAPIGNDFCTISLSDYLTPWPVIKKRLLSAAEGDFVIVLYNPSSKNRPDHLKKALNELQKVIGNDRPCGLVRNIGRDGESAWIGSFEELYDQETDMFTTVFIGNSFTRVIDHKLVTLRGYEGNV